MDNLTLPRVTARSLGRSAFEILAGILILIVSVPLVLAFLVLLVIAFGLVGLVAIALAPFVIAHGALRALFGKGAASKPEPEPEDDGGEDDGGEDMFPASTVSPDRPTPGAPESLDSETCTNCRFFYSVNAQAGQCRRFTPSFSDTDETATGEWPLVLSAAWCGDFKGMSAPAATVLH